MYFWSFLLLPNLCHRARSRPKTPIHAALGRYRGIIRIIILFLRCDANAMRLICRFYGMCKKKKKGSFPFRGTSMLPGQGTLFQVNYSNMSGYPDWVLTERKLPWVRIHSGAHSTLPCSESDYFPSIWMIGCYYVPNKRFEATECGCCTIFHSMQFNEEQPE